MAVGIRPCTGAVMVLGVANLLNLWLAGIFAVLSMSIGTAITVLMLAILAIQTNHLLARLPYQQRPYWRLLGPIGAIVGGLMNLAGGLLLLQDSAKAPSHPLLSAQTSQVEDGSTRSKREELARMPSVCRMWISPPMVGLSRPRAPKPMPIRSVPTASA
ncbi:High-affinity nickel-transport protein [Thiorhodovibrio winogradskyi]|uniref:High-affinity nickel-transport protein n=1 Tax=Thiorhodovibrio winogradskyi TaxID=77007 RepID=A0ABZ0S7V7_9GAMM